MAGYFFKLKDFSIAFLFIYIFLISLSGEVNAIIDCTDYGSDGIADNIVIVGTSGTNCVVDGTNDQEQINLAVNALSAVSSPASKGTVHLKPGTYYILDTIYVNKNVVFEGSGPSTIISVRTGFNTQLSPGVCARGRRSAMQINGSDTTVMNFDLDGTMGTGNDAGGGSGCIYGIQFGAYPDISHVIIKNIHIYNMPDDGVTGAANDVLIDNIRVSNTGHSVMGLGGGNCNTRGYRVSNIKGDTFIGNAGFRIWCLSDLHILNADIQDDVNWAVEMDAYSTSGVTKDVTIENLTHVYHPNHQGIGSIVIVNNIANTVHNTYNIHFKNILINQKNTGVPFEGAKTAIYIKQATNVTFDGLTIYDAYGDAIRVNNNENSIITVKNSILEKGSGYGIYGSGPINWDISYNDIHGFTSGPYGGNAAGDIDNIYEDPLFADPATNDFHLQSPYGRWDGTSWVTTDPLISPAIDKGDPASSYAHEPDPNGARVNMGFYGNTPEASKSQYVDLPPTIISTDPLGGAVNVSAAKTIRITFSENIEPGISYDLITLTDSSNNPIATVATISGNTLTLDPSSDLGYSTQYTVTIPAQSVKDLTGNDLAGPYTFSFTTSAPPVLTSITITPSYAIVMMPPTQQFTATAKDQFGNDMSVVVTWSSSNLTVGTISADGLFDALSVGTSIITASSGAISATATVTVRNSQDCIPCVYCKRFERWKTVCTDIENYCISSDIPNSFCEDRRNACIQKVDDLIMGCRALSCEPSCEQPLEISITNPLYGTLFVEENCTQPQNNTPPVINPPQPATGWTHLSSKVPADNLPAPNTGNEQTASLVLDIDKDGTDDFVIAERTKAPAVVWYKKTSSGWNRYIVENTRMSVEAGGAFNDIDNDGDLDIVFGGDWQSNQIWWWENPYPAYSPSTPWVRHTIKNTGGNQHHDQIFGDFDGDGKAELVTWNQYDNKLLFYDIPSDAKTRTAAWPSATIFTWTQNNALGNPEGFDKADIDGDGKLDIVGGGRWFKHNGGTSFTEKVIDNNMRMSRVVAGQWKKGGAPEVILSGGDRVKPLVLYEYNSVGDSWTSHNLLGYDPKNAHSLQLADINADGNLDIFVAEMTLNGNTGAKSLIIYGDGNGGISSQETISTGIDNHESRVGDLDGDGDLDIMDKPYNGDAPRVDVWLQNTGSVTGPSLDNWQYHEVDASREKYEHSIPGSWYNYFGLSSSDANGDNCKDIVSGKYFYKNPGCNNLVGTWTRSVLPNDADGALFANVDGDSNADIIAFGLPDVYWFEATDAGATSWALARKITLAASIATDHRNPQASRVIDINKDGRPEILFEGGKPSAGNDGLYALEIPSSPTSDAWTLTRLTSKGGDGFGVGDLDGDGDLDVTIGQPNVVKWYENQGTLGLWPDYSVNTTVRSADRFEIADIDGDSRPDIIVSEETYPDFAIPGSAYWFKNPADPKSSTWARNAVGNTLGYYAPMSMAALDMDKDGDIDVVLGEHQNQKRMFVLENDGSGHFTEHLVGTGKESHGLIVADIDNDNDYDILHIGWNGYQHLHLWENKGSQQTTPTVPPIPTTPPIPPSISINASKVLLEASVKGNVGLTRVQFFVDGEPVGPSIMDPPYETEWDYSTSSNGIHNITAIVTDSMGNAQASIITNVEVCSSGITYKEYTRVMNGYKDWRVTDPQAPYKGEPSNSPGTFLPNSKLPLSIDDLDGATRAEAIIDMWGGHPGTTNKRFRFNSNAWITIPELSTTPTAGQCYNSQTNPTLEVPLSDLVAGTNILEGTSGGQTCYNFGWGQWAWYSATLRVYYDSSKPHIEGAISSHGNNAVLSENATLTVDITDSDNIGVKRVDYFAYYDGYDVDGDGIFPEYQVSYQRAPAATELIPSQHIGTATSAPYSVQWDTTWVPDQAPGSIKIMARILGNNGFWYATPEVTGLSLARTGGSVILYKPENVPERFWVLGGSSPGSPMSSKFTIPAGDPLDEASDAKLLVRTWNGGAGKARVNNLYVPGYLGTGHFYSYVMLPLKLSSLKNGTNTVTFSSYVGAAHHGIEILWPGPAVVVKYNVNIPPASPPTFTPPGGPYTVPQTVTITTSTLGATIRYTLDGTDPTETSPVYEKPISIATTKTLKAKTWRSGLPPSGITTATYTIGELNAPWWIGADGKRNFRLPLVLEDGGYERLEKPVDIKVDFTQLLGGSGTLDENSIRVVKIDSSGTVLSDTVPFQFDKDSGYNAATKASGNIVFIVDRTTQSEGYGYYYIYFDVVGTAAYTPLAVAPQVGSPEDVPDEGKDSYKIATGKGTYYMHKPNGGLSSLVDSSGKDWISFNTAAGTAGMYRGIPNSGYPENIFHPGYNKGSSSILSQGPLKASIRFVSSDGLWEGVWDFYPQYATITILKAGHSYWVLYEGTPGGSIETNTDYMYRPDGTKTLLKTSWDGDLPNNEWVYFTDPNVPAPGTGRSLFIAHREDDKANDIYWPMQNRMTVFGFGRSASTMTQMTSVPQHFTIGFMDGDGNAFIQNSKRVYSAYKDMLVNVMAVQKST